VAQSQSGKWVSRVGSTGGGKNYRSRRPLNFYGVLGIIVVLGLASVILARHNYRSSSAAAASKTPPLIGTTQYAALGFDICGTQWPTLTPGAGAKVATSQLALQADGVVKSAPLSAEYAGDNANLAKLAPGVPGLSISTAQLTLPAAGDKKAVTLKNGDACPAGTAQAGKKGSVLFSYWKNFSTSQATTTIDPTAVRFTANSLVTVGFVSDGSKPSKPSQDIINKMLVASQSGSTTPTTAPATPSTPAIASTTTTAPSTTTSK
jgi:hypothetical protein